MDAPSGIREGGAGRRVAEGRPDATDLERLREAAREFEALFVRTLLRSMRQTVPESGIVDDQGEIKYYRQLYDEELANRAAGAGSGLGVADLIVRQFAGLAEPGGEPAPAGEDPGAERIRRLDALVRYRQVAAAGDPPGTEAP